MDGVVLRRDGEVGEIVGTAASDVLMWVGQPRPLRVVADVNEDDISRVQARQKVLLRHEGYAAETPLVATVGSVTPKGDAQTKTFRVYLTLPDATPLKIGMSVEANIVLREATGALLVPAEAVSGGVVQVIEDGKLARRTVTTGLKGSGRIEIMSGIAESDSVLAPFRSDLAPGKRVRGEMTPAGPKSP
jgi:multidrug efflux pump subunit AcrA (membrane-fusion protein)